MGSWSTSIPGNDDFADVYAEIFDQFNNGLPIHEVIDKTYIKYEVEFADEIDSLHNLYFAAAKAEWDCGMLRESTYQKVQTIVESGADIAVWRELGASEADIRKREKSLFTFLEKLSTPTAKPKKPKPIKFKPAIFQKGDVLTILQTDGTYCGAVVLENDESNEEFGQNYIAKANLKGERPPTTEEILSASVHSLWIYSGAFRKYRNNITLIDRIPIPYTYTLGGAGSSYSTWGVLIRSDVICNKLSSIRDIRALMCLQPESIRQLERQSITLYRPD